MAAKLQTVIFLVRHGLTDRLYTDNSKIDGRRVLSEIGEAQVKKVGQYLNDFAPTAMFSSPIERCLETAAAINAELDEPLKIQTTRDLYEIYSAESEAKLLDRVDHIVNRIIRDFAGQQVVAVTHQYIIRSILGDLLNEDPYQIPCESADVYRLVFAGSVFVEYQRLQPAQVNS